MELLFYCLGGLGMFLFSMKSMSEGLQALAGDKLRDILEKGTKTPIRGIFTHGRRTLLDDRWRCRNLTNAHYPI